MEGARLFCIFMKVLLDAVRFGATWALQILQRLLELIFGAGLGDQCGNQCEWGGHRTSCLCMCERRIELAWAYRR
tara:strand:- start:222 stop:446 length:225 start_codon:yes stop_codon:yes gene_type:complete